MRWPASCSPVVYPLGSYGILSTVKITCAAVDPLSGIASSTCVNTSGVAWTFGAGAHSLSASATDQAGNVGTASTAFTVMVKPTDLSTLTTQFVQGSAKYKSSGLLVRLVVSLLVNAATNVILDFTPSAKPATKAKLLTAYSQGLQSLVSGDWLTTSQASTLTGLAAAL
jgi:hypothetical protein